MASRGGIWLASKVSDQAAEGETLSTHATLAEAQAAAEQKGLCVINEAVQRSKFVVRRCDDIRLLRFRAHPNGPWRMHMAPVRIVIGLGCSRSAIQAPRVARCFEVMALGRAPNLIYTCSENEHRSGLMDAFAAYQAALQGGARRDSWRIEVDTRAKTTKGNARFALERAKLLCPQRSCKVLITLVTSDFHMARSRLIFERAADVFLRSLGHTVTIETAPAQTPRGAEGDSYRAKAPELERRQRSELAKGVADDDVRRWV